MLNPHILSIPSFFTNTFNKALENNILIAGIDGTILGCNPAFLKNFGFHEDGIVGKNFAELFTPEDRARGLPQRELEQVIKNGQSADNNYLLCSNNQKVWVSGESLLVNNNTDKPVIIKAIQNIQIQKQSEFELKGLNQFNEDILNNINDIVIVLDERLQLVKANPKFFKVFQPKNCELKHIAFKTLLTFYDNENYLLPALENAMEMGQDFQERLVELRQSDGESNIFEVSGSFIPAPDGTHNLLLVMHDVTMHKQIQREREDIIGFVAHELRNPLSNIGLCIELMELQINEEHPIEMNDLLRRSKNNLLRLNNMISELYNATKIYAGKMVLDSKVFHFGEMIREAAESLNILQPDYQIDIIGDGNFMYNGDRYRLMTVVTNYLSNGIKYSDVSKRVTLKIESTEESLTVSVKDNGLGIPSNDLSHIFERFFRAEKTSSLEGLGLGLYLCQRIIHAHGGTVWAESAEGIGSVFYFKLPMQRN